MDKVIYKPIGKIFSPFHKPEGTPIQPTAKGAGDGKIEIFPEYQEGLRDLDGFSHLILLYHCHKAGEPSLTVKPFLEDKEHGIFSIRAPSRPNSIGLSVVRLVRIEKNILYIKDIDILNETPLLDIKPYVPKFDGRKDVRIGWLERKVEKLSSVEDDGRFSNKKISQ